MLTPLAGSGEKDTLVPVHHRGPAVSRWYIRRAPKPIRKAGGIVLRVLRGPRASWLWALTLAVALLGAAVDKQLEVEAWLKLHKLDWVGSPLGIPLALWWAGLFVLNEIWVRSAGEEARKDWVERQRTIWAKFGANLDELHAAIRNGGGQITEANARATVRSFLARAVDFTSFILDMPGAQFRACVLVVVTRRAGQSTTKIPSKYLQAWQYDSTHPDCTYAKIRFGTPLAGTVAQTNQAMIVMNTDDNQVQAYFTETSYKSVIGFPIHSGTSKASVIGVLTVDARLPETFEDRDIARRLEDALHPIIAAIGMAITNIPSGDRFVFPSDDEFVGPEEGS